LKITPDTTPLAKAIAGETRSQITPLDVFKLARRRWLEGRRISLCELAKELDISRGKLYRWVGNKDLLLDQIFLSFAVPTFERIINETPGVGIDHIVEVHRRFMTAILTSKPLQQFVSQDPSYALRILTRDSVGSHDRLIKITADHIEEQVAMGHLHVSTPADKLAEVLIRTNESIIYSNIISGRSPAIEQACAVTRALLSTARIAEDIEVANGVVS
jgi:AcrR family transcriptional regulator